MLQAGGDAPLGPIWEMIKKMNSIKDQCVLRTYWDQVLLPSCACCAGPRPSPIALTLAAPRPSDPRCPAVLALAAPAGRLS